MESSVPQNVPAQPRTLFSISADISQLTTLLDEIEDNDSESEQLITSWLEHLGSERDRKLDNYAALISELQARAAVRKAEAKRLSELAARDEKKAEMLKERLKFFFEINKLKTLDTPRYKLTLAKNGGKAPLIVDESISPTELPEKFQKISIDLDKAAIRSALEAGESLDFAHLGERGSSLRIK